MKQTMKPIVLASADFGYPVRSVFDDPDLADFIGDGSHGEAVAAVTVIARGLEQVADVDGCAIHWPGRPFLAPRSAVRWMELLDARIADLQRVRAFFAEKSAAPGVEGFGALSGGIPVVSGDGDSMTRGGM